MKRLSTFIPFALVLGLCATLVPQLTAAEKGQANWRQLFNGKDFSGWQNAAGGEPGAGWVVEDGAMVRKSSAGDVWTKERFGNFVLDLEFKTEGNSGIFIRTDKPSDCVQTGLEIQVLGPSRSGKPSRNSCGSLYDAQAPTKDVVKAGQWNRCIITAVGSRIRIEMNGEKIVDMDLDRWDTPGKNPDGTPNKFRNALKDFKREGHVGLQDHGAVVAYRSVKIKPLDGAKADRPKKDRAKRKAKPTDA
jgi:hypothetical protein